MGTPRKDLRLLRGDSLLSIDDGENNDKEEAPVKALSKTSSLLALNNHDLYIPKDIIFHIFTFTGRNQLAICSQVCKLWKVLASDSYFGWVEIQTILIQDVPNYEAQGIAGKEAEYQYITVKNLEVNLSSPYTPVFEFTLDGKTIGNLRTTSSVYHLKLDEMQQAIKTYPRLWRCDVYSRKHKKLTIQDYVDYELRYELNIKEFEKMEAEKKEVPCAHLIYSQVRAERYRKLNNNTFRTANIPRTVTKHNFKQPEGFKDGVNLYKYQLNAVAWMKSLEDNRYEKTPYCYLTPWRKAQSNRLFDLVHAPIERFNQPLVHPTKSLTDVPKHLVNYTTCGGVIADEMGLGKTMEMIGLILANRRTKKKTTKSKKKKGTELFDGPTLVLCPSHLVHQWVEEITTKTNDMKYIVMTTINQVKAVTYGDVLAADVVIASYQLLRNPSYFFGTSASSVKQKTNISKQDVRLRPERMEAELRTLLKKSDPLAVSKPVLDHFEWQRIILDEGHEVLLHKDYQASLEQFKFKFKWIVSGTPFPSSSIMGFMANQFIDLAGNAAVFSDTKREILLDHLYWKNTKDSVKDEYKIPPLVEELVLLNFTDVEQIAYDHSNAYVKSELCCQHGGMQLMTLTEYRTHVIDQHKLLLDQNEKSLPTLQAHYEQYKRAAERDPTNQHNKYMAQSSKRELDEAEKQIANSTKCIKLMGELKEYDGPHDANIDFVGYSDSDGEETAEKQTKEEEKEDKEREEKEIEDNKGGAKEDNKNSENEERQQEKTASKKQDNEKEEASADAMDTEEQKDGANKEEQEKTEPKDGEEDKQEKEKYTQEDVDKMTVAQLTRILTKAKIEIPKKSLKAALQALVLSNALEKEEKKQTVKKKKEDKNVTEKTYTKEKTTEKKKKVVVEEDEEEEKNESGRGKRKAISKSAAPPAKRTKAKKNKENEEPRWPLTKEEKAMEAQNLKYLIETSGTKLANLTIYLQRLWRQDPKARVIIFSQFSAFLTNIGQMLARNDIPSAFVEGNVMRREKALKSFKAQTSEIKVILISLTSAASGSNLIQATHIILMDPVQGTKKEALATESQAIGRAHRQGQNNTVTLVRFIIKNTIEYDTYVKNYLSDEHIIVKGEDPSKAQLVHSDNIDDLIDSQLPGRKSAFIDNLTK